MPASPSQRILPSRSIHAGSFSRQIIFAYMDNLHMYICNDVCRKRFVSTASHREEHVQPPVIPTWKSWQKNGPSARWAKGRDRILPDKRWAESKEGSLGRRGWSIIQRGHEIRAESGKSRRLDARESRHRPVPLVRLRPIDWRVNFLVSWSLLALQGYSGDLEARNNPYFTPYINIRN